MAPTKRKAPIGFIKGYRGSGPTHQIGALQVGKQDIQELGHTIFESLLAGDTSLSLAEIKNMSMKDIGNRIKQTALRETNTKLAQ